MDKKLRCLICDLPVNIGLTSLVIIMFLGEGAFEVLKMMLEGGHPRLTINRAINRTSGDLDNLKRYSKKVQSFDKKSLKVFLWRLSKKGLIENKGDGFRLTSLGLKYFKRIKDNQIKKWDGKWRIVMFDIPEKLKKEREWLRSQLYSLEYKHLQKSVFIGKFPISESLFKEIFRKSLKDCVTLITVGEIDNEEILNSFN